MTAATDQLDRKIVAYLRRTEALTAAEITEALSVPMSSVRAALKRLDEAGEVARLGVAANNAYTWACWNPREAEA